MECGSIVPTRFLLCAPTSAYAPFIHRDTYAVCTMSMNNEVLRVRTFMQSFIHVNKDHLAFVLCYIGSNRNRTPRGWQGHPRQRRLPDRHAPPSNVSSPQSLRMYPSSFYIRGVGNRRYLLTLGVTLTLRHKSAVVSSITSTPPETIRQPQIALSHRRISYD